MHKPHSTSPARKPKVLAIAEAANPEWVSVPLVGWSMAEALRHVADVHLVTQIRNRDAVLKTGLQEGVDFTAIDSEALSRPMWNLARRMGMGDGKGWTVVQALNALAYPYFERLIWRQFGDRLKAGEFDLVHRITPLSPTLPSWIANKCAKHGVPFILGPLNGGVPWPAEFKDAQRQEKEWLSRIRGIYKILPGRRATLSASAAILAGSQFTLGEVPQKHREKCVYLPENAVDLRRFGKSAQSPRSGPLKVCFIGRVVPVKGLDMLIEAAVPMMQSGDLTIDIIGDGPISPDLQAQASNLDVAHAIKFHGWQPHDKVQDIAVGCSVFGFPSVKDFGGGAVLEAMALGLAPVVLDYAGPAELVTDETGIKVPMGRREDVIPALRRAFKKLIDDRGLVQDIGRLAKQRVEDLFTWERKAEQASQIYDWVLDPSKEKPDFGF